MYSNKKFDLAGEEWEVKFLPMVLHKGKRVAIGKIPSKRLILVSTRDDKGREVPEEKIKELFVKAITPIAYEIHERKYKEEHGIQ